jgi:hypothetical protein
MVSLLPSLRPWLVGIGGAAVVGFVASLDPAFSHGPGHASPFHLASLEKGDVASRTLRTPRDVVLQETDLRQDGRLEAEVARYVPVFAREPLDLERMGPQLQRALSAADASSGPVEQDPADGEAEREERERMALGTRLLRAATALLAPWYRDGVVADDEFPARATEVRVAESSAGGVRGDSGLPHRVVRYHAVPVARFHRFSSLRGYLQRGLAAYLPPSTGVDAEGGGPASEAQLLDGLIEFLLDRVPPNLRYSPENDKYVADLSSVTGQRAVVVRHGEIIVPRGQRVGQRASQMLAAIARSGPPSGRRRAVAATVVGLAGVLMTLLVQVERWARLRPPGPSGARVRPVPTARGARGSWGGQVMAERWRSLEVQLLVAVGAALAWRGLLLWTSVELAAVPAVFAPAVVAVLWGRHAARWTVCAAVSLLMAVAGPVDVAIVLGGVGGGFAASFVVERRRPSTALLAGAVAAFLHTALYAAAVVLGARDYGRATLVEGLHCCAMEVGGGLLAAVMSWGVGVAMGLLATPRQLGRWGRLVDGAPAKVARILEPALVLARTLGADEVYVRAGVGVLCSRVGALEGAATATDPVPRALRFAVPPPGPAQGGFGLEALCVHLGHAEGQRANDGATNSAPRAAQILELVATLGSPFRLAEPTALLQSMIDGLSVRGDEPATLVPAGAGGPTTGSG